MLTDRIQSVKATNIDIQTSNVDIHGTFITKSSLSLATSNARIKANILLENDSTSGKEPSVHATTTGGLVIALFMVLNNLERVLQLVDRCYPVVIKYRGTPVHHTCNYHQC